MTQAVISVVAYGLIFGLLVGHLAPAFSDPENLALL